MSTLKDRLESDLRASMKARDEVTTSTLRMALAAVRHAEVAGTEARELDDDAIVVVLTREAKKRREAADVYAAAGRVAQSEREQAEEGILDRYLPTQLSDEDLAARVRQALATVDGTGRAAMGQAMRAAQVLVGGRAEGGRVAAEVRRQLGL